MIKPPGAPRAEYALKALRVSVTYGVGRLPLCDALCVQGVSCREGVGVMNQGVWGFLRVGIVILGEKRVINRSEGGSMWEFHES